MDEPRVPDEPPPARLPDLFTPHDLPPLGEVMADGCLVRDTPMGPPRAVAPGYGLPEDPADHIRQLQEVEALARFAEIRRVALVADLVEAAPVIEREERVPCGGDGTPWVPEFLAVEIGGALGMGEVRARLFVSDTLDLKWRHPRLWNRMVAGDIAPWQALMVARMCHALAWDGALRVDAATGDVLPGLAWARAKRLVEGEIAAADPVAAVERERARLNRRVVAVAVRPGTTAAMNVFGVLDTADAEALDETLGQMAAELGQSGDESDLDTRRARALGLLARGVLPAGRPVARIYLHVWAESTVARVEGHGPLPVDELPGFLSGCTVRMTRVIDQRESVPVDAYEVPESMREQLVVAQPVEVAPYGSVPARSSDMDHTVPYARGGSTEPDNLGPLGRRAHRARTHGGYRLTQPAPGLWLWRTPLGQAFEVTNRGTRRVVA
ncbi:HNH endonuclease signature motif containing protein [Raineyella fluvialis]|uniref:DUF222 domain-containing protein n=1 Tax=Raineyella fluvialis TaxID=2662261 RepID=A0A5Q2FG96_9ACTN|nr:HNH endonuclease signature motif containing protein [Raineyella fluvialis]QGF23326.1 hypothetical protein Rai3103_06230 [Raineyella fluvialis]